MNGETDWNIAMYSNTVSLLLLHVFTVSQSQYGSFTVFVRFQVIITCWRGNSNFLFRMCNKVVEGKRTTQKCNNHRTR